MVDFSHLKKYEVKDETVEYVFEDLDGDITLDILPATQANRAYFNHILKAGGKKNRRKKGKSDLDIYMESAGEDMEAFSKYVVKGWKNVVDTNGKEVAFNEENCKQFLEAIPEWIFVKLRVFASDATNFVDFFDTEEVAKN